MSTYRVSFFKNLLSSDGHQHRCLQQQIDVSNATSPRQAAQCAALEFEKLRGERAWAICADLVEVESQGYTNVFIPAEVFADNRIDVASEHEQR